MASAVEETEEGSPQFLRDVIRAAKQGSVGEVSLTQNCKSQQLLDIDSEGYMAPEAGADDRRLCGPDGRTPLHAAAVLDQVTQLPVERGKEPDCLDNENATPFARASCCDAQVQTSDSTVVHKELQFWIFGPRHLSPKMIIKVACTPASYTAADVMKQLSERSKQSLQTWRGPEAVKFSSDLDTTVVMLTREESWAFYPEKQSFPANIAHSNIQSATYRLENRKQQMGTRFICSCNISAGPDVAKSISFKTPNAEMKPPSRSKERFCSDVYYSRSKPIHYIEAIAQTGTSVCRIYSEKHGDLGTGTLVFRSENLIVVLTAQHVLEVTKRGFEEKSNLKRVIFRFHCKETTSLEQQPKFYANRGKFYVFSPSYELDYALIAVEQEDRRQDCMVDPVPLRRLPQEYVRPGKWCFAIHHSCGRLMETGWGEVGSIFCNDTTTTPKFFQHSVDTEGGASGASVCDDRRFILGVHTGEDIPEGDVHTEIDKDKIVPSPTKDEDSDYSSSSEEDDVDDNGKDNPNDDDDDDDDEDDEDDEDDDDDDHDDDGDGDDSSSDSITCWNRATHINAIIDDLMHQNAGFQQNKQDIVAKLVCDQRS